MTRKNQTVLNAELNQIRRMLEVDYTNKKRQKKGRPNEDSSPFLAPNNNAIDHSINNTMQLCATIFDVGLNSKYATLCDKIMITLDKQCRETYYTFCFGNNWVNYELPKHKNPPWCNTKGIDC